MWAFKSSAQRLAEYKDTHSPQDDGDFVQACNLPAHPQSSAIALGVRDAVVELGEIDAPYIRASDRFDQELTHFAFWGSLDTIAVVLEFEKHLGVRISDDDAQHIRNPEMAKGVTVADFVADVFKVVSPKMAAKQSAAIDPLE
jgi:acyl carrier protein